MKKLMMILCLAVMAMFLVSCAPGQAVRTSTSDAALKTEIVSLRTALTECQAGTATGTTYSSPIISWSQKEVCKTGTTSKGLVVRVCMPQPSATPGADIVFVKWSNWMGSYNEWVAQGWKDDDWT